jgi:succinoglycan biosynthesis transport protein ExoP
VQNLQPALVKLLEDSARAGQQLQTYRELLNNPSGPQIPEAIREEVERKPIVMERDATIASIRALIRAQRERFGPRHLSVRQLENRLAAEEIERQNIVESQMRETFGAVVENLDNSVRNLDAAIEDTRRRLAEAERRLRDSTRALKQHDDMASEREGKLLKKAEMEKAVSDLRLLLARGTRIRVLARAQIPDELAFPRIIPMTAIGVVLVVGLTAGVITLREIREQRVRGPADVALIPRTRVLGVIPDISLDPGAPERAECAIIERPHGAISESIRQLRTALCKELVTKNYKTVLVLSGMPGSGTSSLLSNLAINAGATDMRVLIVDANLRRPKMHEIFKTHDRPGFADVLLGEATLDRAIVQTGIRNVSVLPCGRRDVPVFERYTTPAMAEIFKSLRERYDLVLIDTTPGVVAGDGVALAAHCDACFMVARAYSEKRGLIARLRNQLTETGVEFLGVVVNAVKPSAGGYMKRNIQVTHEYGREGAAEMPPHADQQKKNSDDKPAA